MFKKLVEGFFDKRKDIEDNIKSFDVMPNLTDVSFESWILRLSLYGRVHYHYKNTDTKVNKKSDFNEFMDVMDKDYVAKALSSWDVDKPKPDTVVFNKQFWGKDGKAQEEEFVVRVEFRPEVKRIFKM